MTKPLHAGRSAEGGVLAALCARAWLTGVADMFEGERGFGAALSEFVDWGQATAGLGDEWTIQRMTCKPYPCCGHTFAAIDAARAVMAEGVDPGDIERSTDLGDTDLRQVRRCRRIPEHAPRLPGHSLQPV
jgi:2-methylcitrate dehydratase PrpD